MTSTADQLLLPVLLLVSGALVTAFGVRSWRRWWVVADTPTSSCGAVFVGRNEVVGRPRLQTLLTAPVTGQRCVWFRWKLERHVGSGKSSRWETVEERSTSAPFWLVDETGAVLVRPRGAEVDVPRAYHERADRSGLWASHHDLRVATAQGEDAEEQAPSAAAGPRPPAAGLVTPIGSLGRDHRISEWHILPDRDLYVLGTARMRQDASALELAAHHDAGGLLISTGGESHVARGSRRRAVTGLLLGFAAAVLAPAVFQVLSLPEPDHGLGGIGVPGGPGGVGDGGEGFETFVRMAIVAAGAWQLFSVLRSPKASPWRATVAFALTAHWPLQSAWLHLRVVENSRSLWDVAGPGMLLGGLAYLAFVGLLYGVRLHNRLVAVKQQAAAAWSLIDVALRRRHDLLPRLVEVAARYAAHEREVTEAVARQRTGGTEALAPTGHLPGDAALRSAVAVDHREARGARALLALSEAYPDLQADQVFQDLARRITQAEDQVAYARRFYNDAVTVLRDRRRTFPGILVAPLVRTPSWQLFQWHGPTDPGTPAAPPPPLPAPPPPAPPAPVLNPTRAPDPTPGEHTRG